MLYPIRNILYRGYKPFCQFDVGLYGFEGGVEVKKGYLLQLMEFRLGRTSLEVTDPIYLNPQRYSVIIRCEGVGGYILSDSNKSTSFVGVLAYDTNQGAWYGTNAAPTDTYFWADQQTIKFTYSFVDGRGVEFPITFTTSSVDPTPLHNSWRIKFIEKNDIFLG